LSLAAFALKRFFGIAEEGDEVDEDSE